MLNTIIGPLSSEEKYAAHVRSRYGLPEDASDEEVAQATRDVSARYSRGIFCLPENASDEVLAQTCRLFPKLPDVLCTDINKEIRDVFSTLPEGAKEIPEEIQNQIRAILKTI